jgi:lysophospholipase L1-like esterase
VTRPLRRTLILLLALVALGSLALNAVLFGELRDSFAKLQFLRIFPLGYVEDAERPAEPPASGVSIAFWGDSRAYAWDTAPLASGRTTLNHAHGAITSSQLLLQLKTQAPGHTDYAVVQIGINDLHPLGALPEHKARILALLRRNLPAIRDALLARSDLVVFTTIIPPGRVPLNRRSRWDPLTPQHVLEANQVIRGLADGSRVVVLDAHAALAEDGTRLADRYTDDDFFLHVNRAGYARLNAELQRVLAEHPPRRR